jgi:mRNA-degrading endonuclease RelE of RelBE toxin-antitoxin system
VVHGVSILATLSISQNFFYFILDTTIIIDYNYSQSMKKSKFQIFYSEEVRSHLLSIDRKYWTLIKEKIEEQLVYEPYSETKNRKPLSSPSLDDRWELRFGPQNCFRVFYKIDKTLNEVIILAIGIKIKEKLYCGKKEIKL